MKTRLAQLSRFIRIAILVLWAMIVVSTACFYLASPSALTAESIAAFLSSFQRAIWAVYLTTSALRGLTLLPSTPLVIAGTLLYPDQPWLVLAISLIGIALSSTMIYFFSEYLGFHDYFEKHKPEVTNHLKSKLEQPLGVVFVALWAFFPLVPTDLVCYLAGTTAMNYWKFIAAVLVGETILCSFYIFFGGSLVQYFR